MRRLHPRFVLGFSFPLLVGGLLAATAAGGKASEWVDGPGYRYVPLQLSGTTREGFLLLSPAQTGVAFTNSLAEQRHLTNQILLNGSGVAAGDVDGDGWCDLFFCGLGSQSRLYRNLGNWKFQDVTESSGVNCAGLDATGAAFADLDGDGDLDLVVNSLGGGTHVFLNDGRGRFTGTTQTLNPGKGGMSLALADIDGDGDLDLYIANYRLETIRDQPNTRFSVKMIDGKPVVTMVNGRPITDPDLADRFDFRFTLGEGGRGKFAQEENGEADALYLNEGTGRFRSVSFTGGVFLDENGTALLKPPLDWGLSVMFRDIDGDGSPDIYVCNDFRSPDRIWLKTGTGRFRAIPFLAFRQTSLASMAVDFADLNRDGRDEIFVADMLSPDHRRRMVQRNVAKGESFSTTPIAGRPQSERNTLFLNRGDGTYAEIAQYCGLEASEWSWASIFLDVDLDGYEDLLVANGFERDNMNLDALHQIEAANTGKKLTSIEQLYSRKMFPRLATKNLAFRNLGDLRFEDASAKWGFNAAEVSQGMCLADLDNDGDLDVIVNNLNGPAGIYRNESGAPRVGVRLKGIAPNTHGIGAKIWVYGGAVPMQSQEMICGGRYLSSDDAMRVFAAGNLTNEMRIEVKWRSGKRSLVNDVRANRIYEIAEVAASAISPQSPVTRPPPAFEDVSHLINHVHHEDPFNDFERQPLLPKKLSQLGPGLAWYDLDGDGREDLVIGSGKGGKLAVYRNEGKGNFSRMTSQALDSVATRSQTGVLGIGQGGILVGSANYEDGLAKGESMREFDLVKGTAEDKLPAEDWSVGPLALGDLNGDGALDVVIGGAAVGGKYPQSASSRVYRDQRGRWVLDQANSTVLDNAGLVSGAVLSDLDGDGLPELILACEWGPLKVFHNAGGKLVPWNPPVTINGQESTLDQLTGWWNGVTTGDFDGDGRMDILASNWGRNTKYEHHRLKPLRLYYGDFAEDGGMQMLETHYEPGMNKQVPLRLLDVAVKAMPFLAERFSSHRAYADAGIEEVLGDRLKRARILEASFLDTAVFLNRGDHFEARVLPMEAQLAPAFAVCVGDFDGDGNEDVFLSQNFFSVEPDTSRYDAGRGLWLKGDGKGNLRAVPGQESGVTVYGEQRGAALCDYDGDGRVDLAVTQHNAETKLFRNVGGKPGLRVRMKGPDRNPLGVGAVVRLKYRERFGPAREIHAGSGYWSQDSAVSVLGEAEEPAQLWVRWPGGKEITYSLPPAAVEVELRESGELKLIK